MKKQLRRFGTLWLAALLCLGLFCGCRPWGVYDNRPYEPDTPAPSPHDGVFVSDHGTMTFNGDGETVLLDFDGDLAGWLGLPAGERAAAYEFRSGDLPPHGYVPVRYDTAMTFWITVGEGSGAVTVMVRVGEVVDGQFRTGTNCTAADRITFMVDKPDGGREPVDFLKK